MKYILCTFMRKKKRKNHIDFNDEEDVEDERGGL